MNMIIGKVNKIAVHDAIKYLVETKGGFTPSEVINQLEVWGYAFGDDDELYTYARSQMIRSFMGRIRDINNKRMYVSSGQISLFDGHTERMYMPAETLEDDKGLITKSSEWLRRHIIGVVERIPPQILPQEAINEIVTAIKDIFAKYAA